MIDHRSYTHNLSSYEIEAEKKNRIRNFYGYTTNSKCDQLPDGLVAQSVEHCTGIAEVMRSNPVQA